MGAEQQALFEEAAAETGGFAFVVRSMTLDFLKRRGWTNARHRDLAGRGEGPPRSRWRRRSGAAMTCW